MAQYQITVSSETLQHLFSGDTGMAKLVENVLNQVLEAQASEQLGAVAYERTDERQGYRNGYRSRTMNTRVGELNLDVPRFRKGSFSTDLFGSYQRSEQALLLAMMEMVINGVSTRKVQRITEQLCGTEFSKSTVSELCKALDPVVKEWNERDLAGHSYPFVLVDAIYVKVRIANRVRPQSCLIATGVNGEGYREILGFQVGDSESEDSWSSFFAWLKGRGLSKVDLVVSDNHKGLVKAVQREFQGVAWQRCQVHFTRNIMDKCPKRHQDGLHEQLRRLFDSPDMESARRQLKDMLAEYATKAPQSMECLEEGFEDAMAVIALPAHYRRRLRSTNSVERLNEEVRRRERVVRIFPNLESAFRLLGAILMEVDEQWMTGHKYFNMDEYWSWKAQQVDETPRNTTNQDAKAA